MSAWVLKMVITFLFALHGRRRRRRVNGDWMKNCWDYRLPYEEISQNVDDSNELLVNEMRRLNICWDDANLQKRYSSSIFHVVEVQINLSSFRFRQRVGFGGSKYLIKSFDPVFRFHWKNGPPKILTSFATACLQFDKMKLDPLGKMFLIIKNFFEQRI